MFLVKGSDLELGQYYWYRYRRNLEGKSSIWEVGAMTTDKHGELFIGLGTGLVLRPHNTKLHLQFYGPLSHPPTEVDPCL